jgi:phosphoglycolate phosphatase
MNSSKSTISAVFFDLDGTLLDTAPDMVNALNYVLQYEGKAELPYRQVRDTVSHGSAALINLGFGEQQNMLDFTRRQTRFLDYYAENICVDTILFAGMEKVLTTLEQMEICWGIVTNKPAFLTQPLLIALNLSSRACSVISGDTLPQSKPSPEPLYAAANQCGVLANQCIYVGDAQRDIEAANNANMFSLLANYGYIDKEDAIKTWQAKGIIQTPEDILAWLN